MRPLKGGRGRRGTQDPAFTDVTNFSIASNRQQRGVKNKTRFVELVGESLAVRPRPRRRPMLIGPDIPVDDVSPEGRSPGEKKEGEFRCQCRSL